jgi:5-methylcytosine-specific restriction endonuclease McrA
VSPKKRKLLSKKLKARVFQWGENRCSYCLLPQKYIFGFTLHCEHIYPVEKGGTNAEENLCLACAWCNSAKSTTTEALDPVTETTARLYNPRKEKWTDHFEWDPIDLKVLCGKTPTGRATIIALDMNAYRCLEARAILMQVGWHPPF